MMVWRNDLISTKRFFIHMEERLNIFSPGVQCLFQHISNRNPSEVFIVFKRGLLSPIITKLPIDPKLFDICFLDRVEIIPCQCRYQIRFETGKKADQNAEVFTLLRQLSVQEQSADKVLDVDATIHDTCENAGTLQIRYKNPRKHTVKVLLLMDSGGSMDYYSGLCSMLFQAATKSNHFKELHTYYFHNCIYSDVYETPRMWGDAVDTEWLLKNYDSSYKVIIVGDATMAPGELWEKRYNWGQGTYGPSGLEWLERFRKQYPYLIWLNPEPMPATPSYWSKTHYELGRLFEMYELSTEGLEAGMKRLMVRR